MRNTPEKEGKTNGSTNQPTQSGTARRHPGTRRRKPQTPRGAARAGEQGGALDFGLDWSVLDGPIEVAKATLQADIVTKINKYTPDVAVARIEWSADADGSLTPKVVLKLV